MPKPNPSEVFKILCQIYPEAQSELNFKNDYELVVSVVLSAQCTDKKVNQVTPALFARCPDFKSLGIAEIEAIETIIRPINYYKTKSKNLKALGNLVTQNFKGKLPTAHEDLLTLPGVGRKTANVVLSEQGQAHALAVDTHVLRVSNRLGLTKGKTPDQVEQELMKQYPSKDWRGLHHRLIFHGRRICKARTPLCGECGLNAICPSVNI